MLSKTRLLIVLAVTILCLYIVWPTLVYFTRVATLPDNATELERAKVAEMLEGGSMIRLGLDLQGGADFLLAVDTSQLIRRAVDRDTESLRRELQRAGVDATVRADRENQTITFFLKNAADANLAADVLKGFEGRYDFSGFTLDTLSSLTNPAAPGVLRMNTEVANSERRQAFEGALKIVGQRVDTLGLTNPVVVRQGEDRIRVQIPGETKPERVKATILRGAALEFRLLHPNHDTLIQDFIKPGSIVPETGSGVIKDEFLEEVIADETGRPVKVLRKDIPSVPAGYVIRLGVHKEIDPNSGAVIRQVDNIAFLLAERPDITGENLVRASWYEDFSQLRDPIQVSLEFDRNGARIFRDVTTNNVGRRFAILLDDVVYSSPNIREPIPGGRAQISGGFSRAEAADLAIVLKAGALKAPLRVLEDSAIGPSLGIESIKGATTALIYGFIFLVVFISIAYSVGGIIAVIATTLNVLLLMALLALMNATLTLSGIGGLLLTMGMAVDANVLIYERLLDELNVGKPPRAAIMGAFDRAVGVILDSNITSLLPALVLVLFEVVSGSVKGFWVSLSIGLLANLYTGLTVTRTLLEAYYDATGRVAVTAIGPFAAIKASLSKFSIDWVSMRQRGLVVSAVLSVAVIALLASGRVRLGVDFTGGLLAQVAYPAGTQAQLHDALGKGFADVQIVKVLNTENFLVTVPAARGAETDLDRLRAEFQSALSAGLGDKATVKSISSVEPQISREFFLNALVMIIITSFIVGSYLAFRFQSIFGIAAAVALIHDVLLTLGINVLLGKALTMDIVSALLVILGYSVNDTIVVFDRIREEMNEHPGMTLKEIVNRGINLTMGRTLFTGVTVLSTLCALWFFGGAALSDFSFTLVVGILFGTYSSWFVAAAIAYNMLSKRERRDPGAGRPQKAVSAQTRLVTAGAVR